MSKDLADRFDRDLSASEETQERARRARKQGAALDVDWEQVLEVYYARANQDPKQLVRFPETDLRIPEAMVPPQEFDEESSGDDEQHESATR